jgi:simple sugar transport system substrate-binding protein
LLADAVESVDRTGTINLGTFDLNEEALNYVLDGTLFFAIDQQPFMQGYMPVILLNNLVRYGLFPANPVLKTGPNMVTKDNAAQVIELSKKGLR